MSSPKGIIDLTDDQATEIDVKIIEPTQIKTNNSAILRTISDNGHSPTEITRPKTTKSRTTASSPIGSDIHVVKIVKRISPSLNITPVSPTTLITSNKKSKTLSKAPVNQAIHVPSDQPPVQFSDKKCPVCFDVLNQPSVTLCGHVFCTECIRTVVRTSKQCPICRRKMTLKGFHPLYI